MGALAGLRASLRPYSAVSSTPKAFVFCVVLWVVMIGWTQASKRLAAEVDADADQREAEKRDLAAELIRRAKEQERTEKVTAYRNQLGQWLESQMLLFDSDSGFRKERTERHGCRVAYQEYLDAQVPPMPLNCASTRCSRLISYHPVLRQFSLAGHDQDREGFWPRRGQRILAEAESQRRRFG